MPSLNFYSKTSHCPLQVGTHGFEDMSPLWPHLPGKAIKLFFFCVQTFSHILLSVTPWTITCHAPLFMGFSRQEHWSGLPFPPPGDGVIQWLNPCLLHWQADSLPLAPPSPKILSSRFNSVSRYKGRIHLQCEALLKLESPRRWL